MPRIPRMFLYTEYFHVIIKSFENSLNIFHVIV